MKILLLLLFIFSISCNSGSKEPKEIYIQHIEAEKEFSTFLLHYVPAIETICAKHKLDFTTIGTRGEEPKKIDWYVSKETKEVIQSGYASAHVTIATKRSLHGVALPFLIFLWFERLDNKWYLMTENGYLTSLVEKDKTEIPPAMHEDIKKIFPHTMELVEWAQRKPFPPKKQKRG